MVGFKNLEFLAVIQCRVGSKRLPKKSLKKIGKYKLIEWVIRRVKKSKMINKVVLATTTKREDDILINIAERLNVDCYRGSSDNVLQRFYEINKKYIPKLVIRICADNPFIDMGELDNIIKKAKNDKSDYIFNHIPYKENKYIDGIGAECIKSSYFRDYYKKIRSKYNKEHVTSYIWKNKKKFKFKYFEAPKKYQYPKLKLDIDTIQDYNLFKKILLGYKGTPENYKVTDLIKKLVDEKK